MSRARPLAIVAVCMLVVACDKPASPGASGSAGSGATSSVSATSSDVRALDAGAANLADGGAAAPTTGSAAGRATAWTGAYTSAQAKEPAPKKGDDDGKEGIGDGTITLEIAPDHTAKGTLTGALGESVLYGTSGSDGTITGTVVPKQPTATSFFGTFTAERKDAAVTGKITASRANAGAVRDADFSLKEN